MRILTDQDVYAATVRLLRGGGHEVLTAREAGLSMAPDNRLLQHASNDRRVLVTRDRDHGFLVFATGMNIGVIYLRMVPRTEARVHSELERVLELHDEEVLRRSFVVVEADKHRLRPLPDR